MAILKEYRCAAHGEFEAHTPECPHGCSPRFVKQEIRTPPAFKSNGTRRVDTELDNLAQSYGLSDIANGADGESVMQTLRKKPEFTPSWGQVRHEPPGWSEGKMKTATTTFDPATVGAPKENRIAEVADVLVPPKPRVAHRHRDDNAT